MTVASTPAMAQPVTPTAKGAFHGTGGELFLTWLVNSILTVLTLGIYAAWGKAKLYRYFYSNTEFAGSRFRFTGTGKEIFIGMLKAIGVFAVLFGFLFGSMSLGRVLGHPKLGMLAVVPFYIALGFISQVGLFGAMRYRFSRARYREIAFRLEGNPLQFAKEALPRLALGVITFGIAMPLYSHWRIGRIYNNLSFGNLKFNWDADSGAYWRLSLKGFFLSAITGGIYYFFWYPKMFAFIRGHLSVGGNRFQGEIKPEDFFLLMITNMLLAGCTLGIALPWVMVRTMRFFLVRLELENPEMLETALQAVTQKGSAGGEALADAMDMGVGIGF
jgi:uncharacterized membrane protein YjgN (DUF898 family)